MTEPAAPAPGDGGLVRLRLDLGYDGTDFSGWAAQPGRRTVQDLVESALAQVLRLTEPPRTTVAGRTDAGVHARHQVCHVDVPESVVGAKNDLGRRLNGVLPPDVRVHGVGRAPTGFDARFAASWRRYVYRVADHPEAIDPLHRHEVLAFPRHLDVGRLNQASAALLGEHDFAAFCRRRPGASTVRTLLDFEWSRETGPYGLVLAIVRADAFCHSMVRALVGCALPVGDGRRGLDWPAEVLRGGVRHPAVTVAPARGLTLEEVAYPSDSELSERVVQARTYRG